MPTKMRAWRAQFRCVESPTEEEFVAEYAATGRDGIDNWHFYLIYNMFRSAGIIQGVYKRGLDGNASSAKALEYADARARSRLGAGRPAAEPPSV